MYINSEKPVVICVLKHCVIVELFIVGILSLMYEV